MINAINSFYFLHFHYWLSHVAKAKKLNMKSEIPSFDIFRMSCHVVRLMRCLIAFLSSHFTTFSSLLQYYPLVYVERRLTSMNCVSYGKFIGIISPWLMNFFVLCWLLNGQKFYTFFESKINFARTSKCNNLRCSQESTRNISSVDSISSM